LAKKHGEKQTVQLKQNLTVILNSYGRQVYCYNNFAKNITLIPAYYPAARVSNFERERNWKCITKLLEN